MTDPQAERNAAEPSPWLLGLVFGLWLTAIALAHHLWIPGAQGLVYDALVILLSTGIGTWFLARHIRLRRQITRQGATIEAEQVRQRATAVAEEQWARMQAIVATATEGIITIDQEGRIDTFNHAAENLFGYTAAEALGKNVSILMPPPHRDEHDGYIRRYIRTGERRIIGIGREVTGLRKDGTTFPIDLSVGEGFYAGKRFFTAIIRDLTDRKEMQAKLSQAERLAAVGELAAGVAHEVNNPINIIINSAQLLKDGDDSSDHSAAIIEEGERIADIVRDLLQFARDDQDRPQSTSIPEVIERTMRLMGENLKRHGIRFELRLPAQMPQVRARPQQLQQVLLNLLINAKDALVQDPLREPKVITVSAEPMEAQGPGVVLAVRDNGPGIPPDLGNRIFEPFVTTKRAKGGTGLGLSISKSIVEGYGGTIEVSSTPGQHTEFRVWLPRD
ncbi:MAG: hypothetical protein Fur0037_15860 [Planctomycetota bacterium]